MTSQQEDVRSKRAARLLSALPSLYDSPFPIKTGPVKIDAAIVGWTIKDQYFGVKFLDIKPTERLALDQSLLALGLVDLGHFDFQ